jgi:hypothetical protein
VVLQSGGQVRRLADDRVTVGGGRRSHLGADDDPGVHRDADPELDAVPLPHLLGDGSQRIEEVQAGLHRPAGVVLVRHGMAEEGEDPVADVAADAPLVAPHRRVAGGLVRPQDLPDELRVALLAQGGGPDHVAEHHGELAALTRPGRRRVGPVEQVLGLGALRQQRQGGAGEVAHGPPVGLVGGGARIGQQVAHPLLVPPFRHASRGYAVRRW